MARKTAEHACRSRRQFQERLSSIIDDKRSWRRVEHWTHCSTLRCNDRGYDRYRNCPIFRPIACTRLHVLFLCATLYRSIWDEYCHYTGCIYSNEWQALDSVYVSSRAGLQQLLQSLCSHPFNILDWWRKSDCVLHAAMTSWNTVDYV